MSRRSSLFYSWCLAFLVLPPVLGEVEPAPGFLAVDRLIFEAAAVVGGVVYSPDGDLIVYDKQSSEVRLYGQGLPRTLAKFELAPFGSFLILSPDKTAVIFGENLSSNIYSIPLSGSGPVLLDNVGLPFDIDFDRDGRGFVSALLAPSNPTNSIVLLDRDPASTNRVIVTNIDGVSGPLALDDHGDLYYGTADFLRDPQSQSLVRFTRDQVL